MCLCVCLECYSCSRINEVQVRVSIGTLTLTRILVRFSWIVKCGFAINNASSRVIATWNAIAVRSKTSPCSVATLFSS